MKICPTCHQTYTDDSLNFCLNDGSTLQAQAARDEPPPTVFMNQPRTTNPQYADETKWGNAPVGSWQNPSPMQNQPFALSSFPQSPNQTVPTLALVFGILSLILICCYGGFYFGIAAVILGYIGMNNANNDSAQYGGKNLAIAGMICGAASFVIALLIVLIAIIGSIH
ncbi:MAG: DUF4190 domain-containing protein [Pyrinomonadaceae bacterium]